MCVCMRKLTKMCERFPYTECIDCLPRLCKEEDDCVQGNEFGISELQNEIKIGFEIKDFWWIDEKNEYMISGEENAVVDLLRTKGINCSFDTSHPDVATISKSFVSLENINVPNIALKMFEHCVHARETVLSFREPVKECVCKGGLIDGSKMHRDTSMPRQVN